MSDHIYILIGLNPNDKISDLVGAIKKNSSAFINKKDFYIGKFHWQDGYGAFSYGKSQLDKLYNYIKNQENHQVLLLNKGPQSLWFHQLNIETYDQI